MQLGGKGQYHGSNDISAALLGEGNFPVYGSGHGYVVPFTSHTPAGFAGEVYANPKTDPRALTYLVEGKLLDFEAMKKAVLPDGPLSKSRDVFEAEQWLKSFNSSP